MAQAWRSWPPVGGRSDDGDLAVVTEAAAASEDLPEGWHRRWSWIVSGRRHRIGARGHDPILADGPA